ncbi:hypothetical protein PACTADRAFT_85914 [Pachysolen tannophilus NRRL Y-2460]|uniref:tRNA-dihydrouridine(47) synthase [NAD(P)(+)] n=1 Tax=Pachysolen tannophilus NRRL Y-2460 TaxID=669874 RepID=A0A1E4TSJ0_PACTA|nr:hypothetical protein PACTADRAFT_85914 [Pachysolen tannophilus NRRL Y-2460]
MSLEVSQDMSGEVSEGGIKDKGIALIKPEFILEKQENIISYDDDEAESAKMKPSNKGDNDSNRNDSNRNGSNSNESKRSKRGRGQNKNRDLKQEHEEIRLCSSLVDPEDNSKVCRFGPEKCRNEHDVTKYLLNKPSDIPGICPVFQVIGYCPAGLKCRWLNSHYDKEHNRLIKGKDFTKEELDDTMKLKEEINWINPRDKMLLQKKKFNFEISEKYIPYLDSLVQSEATPSKKELEDQENEAQYIEAPFKIGEKKKLYLKKAKILSPLTTVGNLPFRRLMKTLGADVTYSEMALALPLLQGNNSEWALPKAHKSEYPGFGVQIATSKHWQAAKACEAISKFTPNVSEINLNCGCPIDLLYRQGQGSALMEQPPRLLRILEAMNACSNDIPITVKLRTGTKQGHLVADNIVKRVVDANVASAITLHGRTRQQRYTKEADWDYIAKIGSIVKETNEEMLDNKDLTDRSEPVWFIGNGDCFNYEDWYKAVETPGIDSVMVARGALIKPWIFEEIEAQQYLDKSASERLSILEKYAKFAVEHWGSDEFGINNARQAESLSKDYEEQPRRYQHSNAFQQK